MVAPTQAGRGQPSPPLQIPAEPLAPLQPRSPEVPVPGHWSSAGSPPDRPVFLEPDAADRGGSGTESVYEQTMEVSSLFGPERASAPADAAPGTNRRVDRVPLVAVVGLAVAVAVVVAAVLLMVGVI